MIKSIHEELLGNDLMFRMIFVEGGKFMMGRSDGRVYRNPVHEVEVSDFYISQYVLTQEIWKAVMDNNPILYKGNNYPVTHVSWNIAKEFIKTLNAKVNQNYRLPTEAEWEYAAGGGIKSKGFVYSGSNNINEAAWNYENSKNETHEVGLKCPNEIGLYDMSGNVWEWCEDDWHRNYESAPTDGSAWIDSPRGASRVLCGGSHSSFSVSCRSTSSNSFSPDYRHSNIGFRLVLPFCQLVSHPDIL